MSKNRPSSGGGSLDFWVHDFLRLVGPNEESSSTLPEADPDETPDENQIPTIRTEADLAAFVWDRFGVRIPNVRVCPGHCSPWEAFCSGYFASEGHTVTVIKGSRGLAGKSFLVALLGTTIATTLRADVTILGGSAAQSNRVHKAMHKFWSAPNAPRHLLAGDPGSIKTKFHGGFEIEALTASQKSVRGPHPLALILDEVDEMDMKIFDASMGQTMDRGGHMGRTIIASTHQYDDGPMTEVLKRAEANGWRVCEWCYRETLEPHGWLTASLVARKKAEMTTVMWNTEVELQEPSPEGRAIDTEKVDRMFMGEEILGQGDEFPYREFEPPVAGATYATGADWARTSDFVEIVTLRDDVLPMRLVAYQKFRKKPTPYIVAQFEHQTSRYPGRAAHDATSLGGKIMHDLLTPEGAEFTATEGVTMVGKVRHNLFTDWILAIEHELVVSPRIRTLYRQHKFVRNDDLFKSGEGHHPPDGFVAGAMACKASVAVTRQLRIVGAGAVPVPGVGATVQPKGEVRAVAPAAPPRDLGSLLDSLAPPS